MKSIITILFVILIFVSNGITEARIPTYLVTVRGENGLTKAEYLRLFQLARETWRPYVDIYLQKHVVIKKNKYQQRNTLNDMDYQFSKYRRLVKNKPGMHVVLAPPIKEGSIYYIAGATLGLCKYRDKDNLAVAWVEKQNQDNADRWWHSVTAVAHEIGHQLGAPHSFCGDVMDEFAWAYVEPGYLPYVCRETRQSLLWCSCSEKDVKKCR